MTIKKFNDQGTGEGHVVKWRKAVHGDALGSEGLRKYDEAIKTFYCWRRN